MELNENRIYSNINRIEKNLIKLSNQKSKVNSNSKLKNSRISFLKNKDESSLNFNIYKNYILSNNNFEDTNKNEELYTKDFNSISNNQNILINSVQLDSNYLKKISSNNAKNKIFSSKTNDLKNKVNNFSWLNLSRDKRRKFDFIKYKYLIGQKNYFKRLFQDNDFGISLSNYKLINPYLILNTKKYINMKISKNNSLQNSKNNHDNKANYMNINIKKFNKFSELKESNKLIFEYNKNKKNILLKNDNLINEFNKNQEQEKIIDYNYNEYLKSISSSESNKSKNDTNNISKLNFNHKMNNLTPLINKSSIYDKMDIYSNIKRVNKNKITRIIKKDNNIEILKIRKLASYRRKFLKNINKNITLENLILRKKILSL